MDAPVMSPFEFAIAVERARHRIVVLLDGAVWHLGTTFAGTRALRVIAEAYGGWTHAGEIGRRMGITRQAAATLVKRHEAAGHVEVVDEGWAKSVRITPAGRVHLQECIRGMDRASGGSGTSPRSIRSRWATSSTGWTRCSMGSTDRCGCPICDRCRDPCQPVAGLGAPHRGKSSSP